MTLKVPQFFALALLVSVGTLCASADDGNSRRGNYGFGTQGYSTQPTAEDSLGRGGFEHSTSKAVPSVSGRILEWSNEGICTFRPDNESDEKYYVKLWLVEMPEEGQQNHAEMIKFIRSHRVYGEGCGNVKLRIIDQNPARPAYKIGILAVSSSSTCQKELWGKGYCGLDDSEKETERNQSEAKKLVRIFNQIQEIKNAPPSVSDSAEEPVDDDEDDEAEENSEDKSEDKTPTTEQGPASQEDKGVEVPGYGFTKPRDDALKGILFDLSHQPKSKDLNTASHRGARGEKEQYESRENQSERLRDSVQKLSTTWNLNILKNSKKYPLSPTIRYTTSIYIPTSSSGTAYGSNSHGFAIPAGESSRSMPCYLCYYEGYFGVPEEGDYRFVGYAEHVMLVGVDLGGTGKKTQTVFYAFMPQQGFGAAVKCGKDWEPARFCGTLGDDGLEASREESRDKRLYKGSWLHLVPDKRYFIKIAFGTLNDNMCARLGIQKKDRDTDDNFPLFTLEKVSFPVDYSSFDSRSSVGPFGSRSSGGRRSEDTYKLRESGQYNSTCIFAAPKEQPKVVKPKTPTDSTSTTTTGATSTQKKKKKTVAQP